MFEIFIVFYIQLDEEIKMCAFKCSLGCFSNKDFIAKDFPLKNDTIKLISGLSKMTKNDSKIKRKALGRGFIAKYFQ